MNRPPLTAHTICPTPLGDLLLGATHLGLAGAWFVHGQRDVPAPERRGRADAAHPLLAAAAQQFADTFAGQRQAFDLPLDLSAGTPFQQAVWRALLAIGHGHSQTYGEVAAAIGRPAAVRAVGTAVGANPLIVVVPCHRVLGANGALTGFGAGLDRKLALLRLEGWCIDGAPTAVFSDSDVSDRGAADPAALRRLRAQRPGAEAPRLD